MTRSTTVRAGIAGSSSALALVIAHAGPQAASGGAAAAPVLAALLAVTAALIYAVAVAVSMWRGDRPEPRNPRPWGAGWWTAALVLGQLAGHLGLLAAGLPAHSGGGAVALHLCAALIAGVLLAAVDAGLAAAGRAGAARRRPPGAVATLRHPRMCPAAVVAPARAANRVRGPPVAA